MLKHPSTLALLGISALLFLLVSCGKGSPRIIVACEENSVGNSFLRWETTPRLKGLVKVYVADNPEGPMSVEPIASAPISDMCTTVITSDPTRRQYYELVFDEQYHVRTATRNIIIPGIQDFRDLGGYSSYPHHKETRWGMLYRSSEIGNLPPESIRELKNLGIRTIIDLRTPREIESRGRIQGSFNYISVPMNPGDMESVVAGVLNRSIDSDTVARIVERINRQLINGYTREFRKVFDLMLNRNNYPMVIHCPSGKDRTGVMTALILSALDVHTETIMEDYRLSNYFFNLPKAASYAYQLPVQAQEALTTLFSARESYLEAAKKEAEKKYGDIHTYLKKGVGLSDQEMKRLRDILLVKY